MLISVAFLKKLHPWFLAIRPKTLPASISPVFIGTAMAAGDGIHHLPTAFLCLLGALLVQIGTNLTNDYFDFKKGIDTKDRVGPLRVTQAGLIAPWQMITAIILTFSLSALVAYFLFLRGGWPIAVIGILGILSGIFYTAGPKPLSALGASDIFVLIFFGPVAVAGTYYAQSFEINLAVILAGLAPGLISTAILTVNNLRDIETDKKAKKKTLAVRFGKTFAQMEFFYCITGACLVPVLIYAIIQDHLPILACSIIMALAAPLIKNIFAPLGDDSLNHTLSATGKLLILYTILFSIGWIL